jgi:hypothetical protein
MRSNPKIEEIKLTTKQLEEIVSLIKRDSLTTEVKNRIIKRYAGGVCLICGEVPTKKFTYNADGAIVIERYCSKHFKRRDFNSRSNTPGNGQGKGNTMS